MKKSDFIALLISPCQQAATTHRVPWRFSIAQAALESAWGESILAKAGRNLFGVKADKSWTGEVLELPTREQLKDGAWVTEVARWRKYRTWDECINDHALFFHRNPRYRSCFNALTDVDFAVAVAKAGYATDKAYARKLIATINALGV